LEWGSKVAEVGVIFGGPSPEHDVSILTGLQAARELAKTSKSVRALFWSKAGEWFDVDPGLEATDFVHGPPKGAARLHLVLGQGGGFLSIGRVGRAKPISLDAVLVCCHGGAGEDGSLQAAFDLAGISHAGPSVAGAALGMDKLSFGALVHDAGLHPPEAALEPRDRRTRIRRSLHRETTIRWVIDRDRGGRGFGDRRSAEAEQRAPIKRSSHRAVSR